MTNRKPIAGGDPQEHRRRSIRLKGYDYALPGAYFVTICTRDRRCVLDNPVIRGIITDVWYALPRWFPTVDLDSFVIMPNHVHMVLWLYGPDDGADAEAISATDQGGASVGGGSDVGATLVVARQHFPGASRAGASPAPTEWTIPDPKRVTVDPALGDVIRTFKSLVFNVYRGWIQKHDPTREAPLWQRNYYEHIVRNERSLARIRDYIASNPATWDVDAENRRAGASDAGAYYRAVWRPDV